MPIEHNNRSPPTSTPPVVRSSSTEARLERQPVVECVTDRRRVSRACGALEPKISSGYRKGGSRSTSTCALGIGRTEGVALHGHVTKRRIAGRVLRAVLEPSTPDEFGVDVNPRLFRLLTRGNANRRDHRLGTRFTNRSSTTCHVEPVVREPAVVLGPASEPRSGRAGLRPACALNVLGQRLERPSGPITRTRGVARPLGGPALTRAVWPDRDSDFGRKNRGVPVAVRRGIWSRSNTRSAPFARIGRRAPDPFWCRATTAPARPAPKLPPPGVGPNLAANNGRQAKVLAGLPGGWGLSCRRTGPTRARLADSAPRRHPRPRAASSRP